MIEKNLVITIHDDRLKSLLSQRGCFPVNLLSDEHFTDWNSGLRPGSTETVYRVVDVLKTLGNLKRYHFVELVWGLPKIEPQDPKNTLF
jgi:hypothetical protein